METGLKLRVSRLFRSSLYSCRHENAFDEVQEPVFLANRDVLPLLPLLKNPCSLTGSIGWGCRPRRWPIMQVSSTQSTTTRGVGSEADTIDSVESDSVDTFRKMLVKITSQNRAKSLGSDDGDRGRTGSSVSPESKSWDVAGGHKSCECYHKEKLSGEKTTDGKTTEMTDEEKNKKRSVLRRKKKRSNRQINLLSRSSSGTGWFSSEEEGNPIDAESEQLFSSKSTISSEYSFETTTRSQRRICTGRRLRSAERKKGRGYPKYSLPKHSSSPLSEPSESSATEFPACTEKVRESVEVVKRSTDPYRDFKESMVEMIVEKKIFGQEDLQELLHCYLSLNSAHHHQVIIKVFSDIWDSLFCDN